MIDNSKFIGGILIISGTTIGAGMLALPIMTGLGGFFSGLIIFGLCWLVMLWTANLYLEVNLTIEGEPNLISMARTTLGAQGAVATWILLLLLLYSIVASYMLASGSIFKEAINNILGLSIATKFASTLILFVLGPMLYFGLYVMDLVNRVLMMGLIGAFTVLLSFLVPKVQPELLYHFDSKFTLISMSIVVFSYGFHPIIPSLVTYLNRDVKKLKWCIFFGSGLPFLIYVLWDASILGAISSYGTMGIAYILQNDISLSEALHAQVDSPTITYAIRIFSFAAIATSFLGVGQSLIDFLRDGLRAKDSHIGRLKVFVCAFLPPLILALLFKDGFVALLEYAGVFVALILGILPILMTWSARYVKNLASPYRAPGGKVLLICGLLFFVFIIGLVFAKNSGFLVYDYLGYY